MASPSILALVAASLLAAIVLSVAVMVMRRQRNAQIGRADRAVAQLEDVADRLWAASEGEELYRSLIEAQGDLIVRREAGVIVYANAAYAALLGLDEEAAIGRDTEARRLARTAVHAVDSGAQVFDECVATPDGERWIAWYGTTVPSRSGRTVVQQVGRDITARVAAERALEEARRRAEEASAAKSRFLATVSHEFRTPLNGILGMADLLDDTALAPDQASYVAALRTSGEALLTLVDDLLDLAKVEAGRLDLVEQPVDLAALAEAVTELMAPRAQAKGLDIATVLSGDLPRCLRGDPDRLRQILLNLVGNAVKFTSEGGVSIRLARDGEQLAVTVADTGPGIPQDRQEAIFAEFEQGDAGSTAGGTGLGLAIVRRLAQRMGGSVSVVSSPGSGAAFTVRLPIVAPEGVVERPDWTGRIVLVASASSIAGPALVEAVRDTRATAMLATSADEARDMIGSLNGLSAVLVDQGLGAEDAASIARVAREAGIEDRIVLAAPQDRRDLATSLRGGYSGFLIKPVRSTSLHARLFRQRGGAVDPGRPQAPPAAFDAGGLRVLVAEDNPVNALLLIRTLEHFGCEPVLTANGTEALAAFDAAAAGARPFNLVLLDVRMPEMDGLEVARRIRSHPRGSNLRLVAVTANVSDDDRRQASEAGFDDCLPKPLSRQALASWIRRAGATRPADAARPMRALSQQ